MGDWLNDDALAAYLSLVSDKPLPDPRIWLRILAGLLITIFLVALIPRFISPSYTIHRRGEAVAGSVSLIIALQDYHAQYGHWPDFTGDGLFLDEQRQSQLMHVLRSKDEVNNPRGIVFFEGIDATESSGKHRRGFDPKTDVFYDPWGQPYRIALDTTGTGTIANPYPDDGPIHQKVIVWSLGKDGQQGAPSKPRTRHGSDDVTNWD